MSNKTLYERLGGYDAICAVSEDLLPRLMSDSRLKRFWDHRGEDGLNREKQLLIDFLCASSGGPMYYTGRDMKVSHKGTSVSHAMIALPKRLVSVTLLSTGATRSATAVAVRPALGDAS